MVSGVDVMVPAFCLREGSSARSCSMTQPVVTPVGCTLSGGGVSVPNRPQLHRHDCVPEPVRRDSRHTRRLRRPTAGASHAPSGAATTLCRVQGVLLRSEGVGRGDYASWPPFRVGAVQGREV